MFTNRLDFLLKSNENKAKKLISKLSKYGKKLDFDASPNIEWKILI